MYLLQNVCYYFLIGSDTEFQISYYEVFNQFEPFLLNYFLGFPIFCRFFVIWLVKGHFNQVRLKITLDSLSYSSCFKILNSSGSILQSMDNATSLLTRIWFWDGLQWNGMQNVSRGIRSRTPLDTNGTLNFECYSLRGAFFKKYLFRYDR